MSNVTQIPDPPQLKVLGCFLSQLPPMIARKEVKYFTGGAISPKSVSNDDYLGNGPKFRMKMGDAVVYPTAFFLAYLEAKGVTLIVPPSLEPAFAGPALPWPERPGACPCRRYGDRSPWS